MLSLSYLPTAERLTVVVVKAKNLVWTNDKSTAGKKVLWLPHFRSPPGFEVEATAGRWGVAEPEPPTVGLRSKAGRVMQMKGGTTATQLRGSTRKHPRPAQD